MKLQIRLHNSDYFVLIFGVCVSIASWEGCCGKIIFPPTNKVAFEGSEVLMECRTDSSGQILWRKIDNPSKLTATTNIYSGVKFTDNFSHFRINKTFPGQYDLLFTASMTVAGQYLCHEPGGEKVYSQLIVLASNPTCFIKEETNFNSTMGCRIRFSGHWFPEMEWEEEYSGERRNESHTIDRSAISEISSQSIATKLTVDRQQFQRKFICITKFKAGGRPASTTAQNIPDYEYKCVVFTNALHHEVTSTAVFTNALQNEITSTAKVTLHEEEEWNNSTHRQCICSSEVISIYILAPLLFLSLLFNGLQVTKVVYKRKRKDIRSKESGTQSIQNENLPNVETHFGPAVEHQTEAIRSLKNDDQEGPNEDFVVHLNSNEGLSKYANINTVPKAIQETANTEYLSLEKRERDLQPALYATLNLNSEYENLN